VGCGYPAVCGGERWSRLRREPRRSTDITVAPSVVINVMPMASGSPPDGGPPPCGSLKVGPETAPIGNGPPVVEPPVVMEEQAHEVEEGVEDVVWDMLPEKHSPLHVDEECSVDECSEEVDEERSGGVALLERSVVSACDVVVDVSPPDVRDATVDVTEVVVTADTVADDTETTGVVPDGGGGVLGVIVLPAPRD
jgi:hypothetical protein